MSIYHKKTALALLSLCLLSILLGLFCYKFYRFEHELLPSSNSRFPWVFYGLTDANKGGSSSISITDSSELVDYSYILTDKVQYPHVTAVFAFGELENASKHIDLSNYSTAAIKIKCQPENTLSIHLHTLDPAVTDPTKFSSYRISEAFSSCNEQWKQFEFDLRHMHVPAWWLNTYDLENSDQSYNLQKARAFSIGAYSRGPVNTPARVSINSYILRGTNTDYLWLFLLLTSSSWLVFIVWLLKNYTSHLKEKVELQLIKNRPLIAYKHLSMEPRDENTDLGRIMRFMATEYSKPETSLETAASKLEINRTRLNEILKAELGLSFKAYLNKLRLVEAARILEEKQEAIVAEIAYKLGYNNATYFNKLFKDEYGCSPKRFRNIYKNETSD